MQEGNNRRRCKRDQLDGRVGKKRLAGIVIIGGIVLSNTLSPAPYFQVEPVVTNYEPSTLYEPELVLAGSYLLKVSKEPTVKPEVTYTEDDLFCMAAVICQEAGGDDCCDYTRLMVGQVVMNRVKSDLFPDTIREVLEAKKQYGRYYWTGICFPKWADQKAIDRAYELAERVLTGDDLPYCPDNVVWQAEFRQGDGVFLEIDDIYFCYSNGI